MRTFNLSLSEYKISQVLLRVLPSLALCVSLGASCRSHSRDEGDDDELAPWHAVASWTWTTEDNVCGICHMPTDGCAPGAAGPGDDSPVVWGRVRAASACQAVIRRSRQRRAPSQCTHYFHLMCITTWLHNKNTCPVCRRKWEFASAPKPAPATPGARRAAGEGFSAAANPPPDVVEAD